MTRILGIETSCDETAMGVVEEGRRILSNVVASSQDFHRPYGGVVPEIASRVHVEVIWQVLEEALTSADCSLEQIDAIAVTQGPGLPGALLIGVAFAKGLALALDRPLIGVDHLAAHLYAGEMIPPPAASPEATSRARDVPLSAEAAGGGMITSVEPPYVGLIVSGGHTLLCIVHPEQRFEVLGETKDDAVGESFDKVAKLLGLGYPGGPAIDRLSKEGRRDAVAFTRSTAKDGFDFSFSGLKTDVYRYVQKHTQGTRDEGSGMRDQGITKPLTPHPCSSHPSPLTPDRSFIADTAASFQEAAVDILVSKTLRACQRTGLKRLVVGGGVAANCRLRERLGQEAQSGKLQVVFPPPKLCVDNGAMIAGLAFAFLRRGQHSPLSLNIYTNSQLN